jgi:hypothetical protein
MALGAKYIFIYQPLITTTTSVMKPLAHGTGEILVLLSLQ